MILNNKIEMFTVFEKSMGEYLITSNIKIMDVKIIRSFLSEQHSWAKNIRLYKVKHFIKHSLCYAILCQGKTVGFTRIVTDYTVFASLEDMFILPEYRGKGLLKNLLYFIQTNSELKDIKIWLMGIESTDEIYKLYNRLN